MAAPPPVPAIVCAGASKTFGGKYAVHSADLVVEAGTIHALVGENGAGKSTLLGLISGRLVADEGSVSISGHRIHRADPREARRLGLAVVYQELTMVPAFTAAQNVFLGQVQARAGFALDGAMRQRYRELCTEFDVRIDPDVPVRDLSVSQQQILEIMRGVQAGSRILMLDEPSAALAEHEREVLYRILDRLRAGGTTIVIVSHNLDEVLRLSDCITVMRDSRVITSAPRADWPDKQSVVQRMVGREVVLRRRVERNPLGPERFAAVDVELPGVLSSMSVRGRAGEIVGLWGLVGSGRTTFFRALCGLEPRASGTLTVDGSARVWPRSVRAAIDAGIVMVPESRRQGLVMGMDAVTNFWLGRSGGRWGVPTARREVPEVVTGAAAFGFSANRVREAVRTLSGGNQQKVLLAKWAGHRPTVFLVDEPTRGIDVGAKSEVLTSLVRLAEEGATVLVTSAELEEVLAICDRLLVVAHGRIVHEVDTRTTEVSVQEIVQYGFDRETA